MIRTLTKRTTPPGPAEPLAEDHLQLLKRARSEECKAEDAGKGKRAFDPTGHRCGLITIARHSSLLFVFNPLDNSLLPCVNLVPQTDRLP